MEPDQEPTPEKPSRQRKLKREEGDVLFQFVLHTYNEAQMPKRADGELRNMVRTIVNVYAKCEHDARRKVWSDVRECRMWIYELELNAV